MTFARMNENTKLRISETPHMDCTVRFKKKYCRVAVELRVIIDNKCMCAFSN